ncbi:hypothetical protein GCM10009624_23690 [Gordonia sinesedis]
MGQRPYRYTNLTSALGDRSSPLRHYLDTEFPHTRGLLAEFRHACGPLLVDGTSASPATVGAAFDFQTRFALDHDYLPRQALYAFLNTPPELAVLDAVITRASAAAKSMGTPHARASADDSSAAAQLARACWVLALATDVYRSGWRADNALTRMARTGRFATEPLMALCPANGVAELTALGRVADDHFLPQLSWPPLVLGPEFAASTLCAADADLIVGGSLIDIKTKLGRLDPKTGVRHGVISTAEIYQLVAYLLFDTGDRYGTDAIGIYSARYGCLMRWPVPAVLDTLAGHPVNVAEARAEVWRLLGGR